MVQNKTLPCWNEHPPYQAIHLAYPYIDLDWPPASPVRRSASGMVLLMMVRYTVKNRKKRMQQKKYDATCARSVYVFPHVIWIKLFLESILLKQHRCSQGDALQWAPSL